MVYSNLAWELAQRAGIRGSKYDPTNAGDPPPVEAYITTSIGTELSARGNTSTEAMQALARELDRWAA